MGHSRHLYLRCTLYDDCTKRKIALQKNSFMISSLSEFHGPEPIGRMTMSGNVGNLGLTGSPVLDYPWTKQYVHP